MSGCGHCGECHAECPGEGLPETYMSLCKSGRASPRNWRKWLEGTGARSDPWRWLGLDRDEYMDLAEGRHTFAFYALKYDYQGAPLNRVWPGMYVRYLVEHDGGEPHPETGWVDRVSGDGQTALVSIQCDDSFNGERSFTARVMDILEVLPFRERPLVYYKTVLCGSCNGCDRLANSVPDNCPMGGFYGAILSKQEADMGFIRIYEDVCAKAAGYARAADGSRVDVSFLDPDSMNEELDFGSRRLD